MRQVVTLCGVTLKTNQILSITLNRWATFPEIHVGLKNGSNFIATHTTPWELEKNYKFLCRKLGKFHGQLSSYN